MPELPEVEVVKLFLQDRLLNHTLIKIDILTPKSFIGNPKLVEGQKITKFTRIGKQLSIHLSNKLILLVHLKMTGQLILGDYVLGHPTKDMYSQKLPNKSTRLIFTFSQNINLFFNDQRKFGWVKIFTPSKLKSVQSNLGFDIFDPKFTPQYLYSQVQKSLRPIKPLLLDQHFFAGIGNIYANDALFLAKIHPLTPANTITRNQSRRLRHHLINLMKQSILAGGSTAKDRQYLHPDGTYGQNQFHFQVYQRTGEPCFFCSSPVAKIKQSGRGTFFCPNCQKKIN